MQAQFDKVRKRALFGPSSGNEHGTITPAQLGDDQRPKLRQPTNNPGSSVNISAVVGGMEASGIQRTPLVPRTQGRAFIPNQQTANEWMQPVGRSVPDNSRNITYRQPIGNFAGDRSFMSSNVSDRSASANEVEQLLMNQPLPRTSNGGGWQLSSAPQNNRTGQRVFAPATNNQRMPRGFRPAFPR
ncbi:hypothetical protein CPB84DRAFT_1846658 [Gymnopilus junonius]|uniref:Uncharacterized protein n=1 Tax=Gymnopilus junonius TaxID=109634 RepID=A0A9P5NRM3_GYMJU|nr:hypothetical protein CPB84DRAFT_1846658 [Gymnopilus junonius]